MTLSGQERRGAAVIEPRLLTLEQVAERLQVHPRTVRRAIEHRGLRAVQVGERRTWRVAEQDLEVWLERRATRPRGYDDAPAPIPLASPRRGGRRRGVGVLSVPSKAVGQ